MFFISMPNMETDKTIRSPVFIVAESKPIQLKEAAVLNFIKKNAEIFFSIFDTVYEKNWAWEF